MAGFDLVDNLVAMGVSQKDAEDLKSRLQGGDLMNLVNALNMEDIGASLQAAQPILRKYNIAIGKGDHMNEYETAQLEALKSGNMFAVEEFIKEWLNPVESGKVMEGFNYSVGITEQSRDRILDWLDENQIEYVANTPELYHIKCEDRAMAYKVSRALSEIHNKMVVRDSKRELDELSPATLAAYDDKASAESQKLNTRDDGKSMTTSDEYDTPEDKRTARNRANGVTRARIQMYKMGEGEEQEFDNSEYEEIMSEKKSGKRAKDAEAKLSNMKDRNPVAGGMAHKSGGGVHSDKRSKSDSFGRGAKHKGRRFEEEMDELAVGDHVMVGEQFGTVEVPYGPNGTVGVKLGDDLEMVAESDVSRLDEGVIGMTDMGPLFRLRELAGMAPAPAESPEDEILNPEMDMDTPADDLDLGSELDAEPAMDAGDELDLDGGDELEVAPDMDPAMDPLADLESGVPGDMPPAPVEDLGVPAPSEAMSTIEDSLNNIQTMLSDIRLSEYKTLVTKLNDLANQVHNMGRDYLGERRKK